MGYPLEHDIIVIDDAYTREGSLRYVSAGEKLDDAVKRYGKILKELSEEGSLTGRTGEQLSEFVESAELVLQEVLKEYMELLAGQMEEYAEQIDRADEEIY